MKRQRGKSFQVGLRRFRTRGSLLCWVHRDNKLTECSDLECETGQRDVDARVGFSVRGGRHASADGLEDERDDVARDEDVVKQGWRKSGGFARDVVDTDEVSDMVQMGCGRIETHI